MQTKFKVAYPKKDRTLTIVMFILMGVCLIVITPQFGSIIFGVVIYGIYTLAVFVALATVLFYVKVDESNIEVRMVFSRKFEFNCSDIEKVECHKDYYKGRAKVYVRILTKSQELDLDQTMDNFQIMAGYILEKLEAGEIKQTSVSDICKRKLVKRKNGV